MTIERTSKEVIIRLSPDVNTEELQKMVNFARYKEITTKLNTSQKEVDNLLSDIKLNWKKKRAILK